MSGSQYLVFKNKKIFVAGATGLIGSHVTHLLLKHGASVRIIVHKKANIFGDKVQVLNGDLLKMEDCVRCVKDMDFVINTAAVSGGLGKHKNDPIEVFTPNLLINTQLLEASRLENVETFHFSSNNSVYPTSEKPMIEEEGVKGIPYPIGFAMVKRMAELQSKIYYENTDMKIAVTRGSNTYGPNDNYNLDTSHVIPALIVKAVEKQDPFVVWGDGESIRDYIHARDLAKGILETIEKFACAEPINIGTGIRTSTKELVKLILHITGHQPSEIKFDDTKPGGQKIKLIDIKKSEEKLGFKTEISLREGLTESVNWYLENVKGVNN